MQPLDHPVWASLTTCHAPLSQGGTRARRVPAAAGGEDIVTLEDADAPEMLALARLTEPGPFLARTHVLGTFRGIRVGGRLAAMAGERPFLHAWKSNRAAISLYEELGFELRAEVDIAEIGRAAPGGGGAG